VTLELREVEWEHPDSVALRGAQRAELTERYGTPDSEPGPAPTADDVTYFVVAYRDGEPVGCGGLRAIDDSHGEIKRMFVAPTHRGSGVSIAVLSRLEDEARSRGWIRLVLETGDGQPDAIRFYEREGYTRIPNFGHYADSALSVCFEKGLAT
jgi:putative acetyltransferase